MDLFELLGRNPNEGCLFRQRYRVSLSFSAAVDPKKSKKIKGYPCGQAGRS
jgi:hypothetical protein